METKLINVFFDANCLPYKDQERQVHFPITGSAFLGASDTTKIRFYFDRIGNSNTTWVAVAKLPNGKQGSKVLSVSEDSELGENYAELSLDNWFTQAKGDVYIALQGYQGGVQYSYDSESGLYEISGTPTIQTTGSVKLAINYAPIGDSPDYTDEFTTYQEILAGLGDKLDITSGIIVVNDITQLTASNYENGQMFYNLADKKLYQLSGETFVAFQNYVVLTAPAGTLSVETYNLLLEHPEYPIVLNKYVFWLNENGNDNLFYIRHYNQKTNDIVNLSQYRIGINKSSRAFIFNESSYSIYDKSKIDTELSGKQNTLVSGTNIKTINNLTLLGSGNIEIQSGSGGGAWGEITGDIQDQTDLQNEFQNVREVAEGKCKTYVLSYSTTAPTDDLDARFYKKPDGTAFTSLSDFNSYVSGLTLGNADFNSQNDIITETTKYFITNDYVVYKLDYLVNTEKLKKGDIFLITETDVPDRWVAYASGYIVFQKHETSKVDLTNYATKTELADKSDLDLIAPEYDDSIGYAIGDLVTYQGKLYKCTTAITTAESWDSTHWTETDLDSDVVKLSGAQTISGKKTYLGNQYTYSLSIKESLNSPYDVPIYANNSGHLYLGSMLWLTGAGIRPLTTNQRDLGSSSYQWKDLYLSGDANISDTGSITFPFLTTYSWKMNYNASLGNKLVIGRYNSGTLQYGYVFGGNEFSPSTGSSQDLGKTTPWKDIYLSGNIYVGNGVLNYINSSGNTLNLHANGNISCEMQAGGCLRHNNFGSTNRHLGTANYAWGDIFFGGALKSSNNANYGLTLPDTTNFTANKEIATTDQINYVVLSDHTQFSALTGDEMYKMRNGGFVPTFATFNGNQRQSIFVQLTAISGTTYKATGWFLDSSRNVYYYEGQVGNVAENSSTNISYSNFVEKKLVDFATTDQAFNVINVADMTDSTHFTADQITLLSNGKPTRIIGLLGGNRNNVLFTSIQDSGTYLNVMFTYANSDTDKGISYCQITKSNGFVNIRGNAVKFGNNRIDINVDNGTTNSIYIQGKKLPDNPPDTGTFVLKCIDGTLTWVAE